MFKMVSHFGVDDREYEDDYIEVDVVIAGKVALTTKSRIEAYAFIRGYAHAMEIMDLEIEYENVADIL